MRATDALSLIVRPTCLWLSGLTGLPLASQEAEAMLLAIGAQESGLVYRTQHFGGPARGLWQFERAGVAGVLRHEQTAKPAMLVAHACDCVANVDDVHVALASQDALACAFARLLLWTVPEPLPGRVGDDAWGQYLFAWRPGRPHAASWRRNWTDAWSAVEGHSAMELVA
jgi:hypothetical protein